MRFMPSLMLTAASARGRTSGTLSGTGSGQGNGPDTRVVPAGILPLAEARFDDLSAWSLDPDWSDLGGSIAKTAGSVNAYAASPTISIPAGDIWVCYTVRDATQGVGAGPLDRDHPAVGIDRNGADTVDALEEGVLDVSAIEPDHAVRLLLREVDAGRIANDAVGRGGTGPDQLPLGSGGNDARDRRDADLGLTRQRLRQSRRHRKQSQHAANAARDAAHVPSPFSCWISSPRLSRASPNSMRVLSR
jgi:hypothetical protein